VYIVGFGKERYKWINKNKSMPDLHLFLIINIRLNFLEKKILKMDVNKFLKIQQKINSMEK